jgi:hypothetical protein
MRGAQSHWVDGLIDNGVAALFALACAFPAFMLLADYGQAMLALAGLTALLAFAAARGLLRQMSRPRRSDSYAFELVPLPETQELGTLELSEADRFVPREDALELDDVLVAVGPDSRVVQLFGGDAPPTAGELVDRIDRHLAGRRQGPGADDSDALFDALDELRRNLR